jgi:hypothetical protein
VAQAVVKGFADFGVHTRVVTKPSGDLPVLVIDGAFFSDFEGFSREFTRLLDDYTWHGNLDAFTTYSQVASAHGGRLGAEVAQLRVV